MVRLLKKWISANKERAQVRNRACDMYLARANYLCDEERKFFCDVRTAVDTAQSATWKEYSSELIAEVCKARKQKLFWARNYRRLVVCVADFHESVYMKGHTYRVDILDDKGIVCSKELSYAECAQPVYLAVDTHQADFYRVEVFDVTSGYRIAIGNPIWNQR